MMFLWHHDVFLAHLQRIQVLLWFREVLNFEQKEPQAVIVRVRKEELFQLRVVIIKRGEEKKLILAQCSWSNTWKKKRSQTSLTSTMEFLMTLLTSSLHSATSGLCSSRLEEKAKRWDLKYSVKHIFKLNEQTKNTVKYNTKTEFDVCKIWVYFTQLIYLEMI